MTLAILRLAALCFFFCFTKTCLGISCKDENDENVDWFIVYKLPKIASEPKDSLLEDGEGYAYLSSSDPTKWKLSSKSIGDKDSILGNLWQEFSCNKKNADLTYLIYNDDTPHGHSHSGSANGHLKGFLAFDATSGFWLIHSIPRFGESSKYEYPKTALTNGQYAFCVTYDTNALNNISNHLLYCNPNIYERQISPTVRKELGDSAQTLFTDKPAFIRKAPFEKHSVLSSLKKEVFYAFAKDNQLNLDLYGGILAPNLNASLLSETWRRGAGTVLANACKSQHTVSNIEAIGMKVEDRKSPIPFRSVEDHSKWAISKSDTKKYWVCFADLNRMASQAKRGGGAVCMQSCSVWKAFDTIIEEFDESCKI